MDEAEADALVTHRDFQVQHEIKLDDKYLFMFNPNKQCVPLCTFRVQVTLERRNDGGIKKYIQ